MEHVASLLRRLGLVVALVATLLVAPGTSALAASAPGAASTPASVAPDVSSKAAEGDVHVIAVTRVPGEQVVDAIAADLPPAAADTAKGGKAKQVAVTVDAEGLAALAASPDVVQVVENKVNRITADAWTASIGLGPVHTAGWDGSGRTIAVLDVGVQVGHPYLAGKVTAEACFSQGTIPGQVQSLCPGGATETHTAGSATPPCDSLAPEVPAGCGHGTHVAGIAAGGPVSTPSDLTGVAPGASILAMKVFTKGMNTTVCQGPAPCLLAYNSEIADALAWISARRTAGDPLVANLDAVNLSLGGGSYPGACDSDPTLLPIVTQVNALRAQGIATVVAAGNSGQNGAGGSPSRMTSPACISSTVSVGATTSAGALASFSNLTAATTIVAPGSSITSSKPTNIYGVLSGTSMATPVVAGAIAALREQTPAASVDTVVNQLRSTGSPLTTAVGQVPELQLDAALLGVPSDVRQVSTTPSDRIVTVSWAVPASPGSSSISGYTVTASPGGNSCTTVGLSCTVSGLVNGSAYAFTVVAANGAGSGAGVAVSATPGTVPSGQAPPAAVPGDRRVSLSWAAPTSNGGLPITGYVARAVPGGQSCTTVPSIPSCTISGLANGTGYTFVVVAANAAGSSAPSASSASVVPKVAGVSPFGSVDLVSTGVGSIQVAGWALDPETATPIQVHVYVDGAAIGLTADGARPDVDAAFGYGANHGFSATFSGSGGTHSVCAFAINAGAAGDNVLLGCRTASIPTGPPFGTFDSATAGLGSISVAGWAIDPDTAASTQVHVYVDGAGYALEANGVRPDVGAAFPGYGSGHGFSATFPASAGAHTVCAFGINLGAGSNSPLGCRTVTVPGGSPIGSLDSVARNNDGSITVSGWSIDPDTNSPVQVLLYAAGNGYPLTGPVTLTANGSRPDVGAVFPLFGALRGYSGTVGSATPAGVNVCAYALNAAGTGTTTVLGCRIVP